MNSNLNLYIDVYYLVRYKWQGTVGTKVSIGQKNTYKMNSMCIQFNIGKI